MVDGHRPTIASVHGMVAAAHPLAAQAGAHVLATGGNAFDAAAATAAALNVVEPYMSGLAGMGLATCYIAAEKRVATLNFMARIPRNFPVDSFSNREDLARGPSSVGAPGNLAGWCELVRRYGRKKLPEIFAGAIRLAHDGFPLIEFNVAEINDNAVALKPLADLYPAWEETYFRSGPARLGMLLKQPELARTYEAIASEGPGYLYGGTLGKAIVAHVKMLGGFLTMEDFADVSPRWQDPLKVSYRGIDVHTLPPPCEGFQFLLTLRALEDFDLGNMPHNGVEHLDTMLRTIRLAAGVRISANIPSPEKLVDILSDRSVETLRRRVRDGRPVVGPTEQWMEPPAGGVDPGHTTSFTAVDSEGNAVCIAQSLGSPFGSGIVVPGTGLCLNNFLYWADVSPRSPNRSKAGGEISICMAPTVSTRNGRLAFCIGTPGSYGILQTQPQLFAHHVDFRLPLQAAVDAPRARLWDGRAVQIESRVAPDVTDALRKRGHDVSMFPAFHWRAGGMHGVAFDPDSGAYVGAADPRRDGYVVTA